MSTVMSSSVVNEAKLTDNLGANIFRACAEHRAIWMAFILDEAKKQGVEQPEGFVRAAVGRCGVMHGNGYHARVGNPDNLVEFADTMFNPIGQAAFEIEFKQKSEERLDLEFHYCPLLKAWQKAGYDDDALAALCDIAMDGDRGIAEGMGYQISITDTIAKGCPTCKISFFK